MPKILARWKARLRDAAPKPIFALYVNTRNRMRGYHSRISFNAGTNLILIRDRTTSLYVCRRGRLWLHKRSIAGRTRELIEIYLLHRTDEGLQGAFIDCGANVGELGAFCRARGLDYHAFEPEPLEADCCDRNNFGGEPRTNRAALWSEDTVLTFYSKPETGDGSVFETADFAERRDVKAITLDGYIADRGIKEVAIIKVEAEGAELEVLQGARNALAMARYLTVDCGFERGIAKESPLVDVLNLVLKSGYEVVDWRRDRLTFLFRNTRAPMTSDRRSSVHSRASGNPGATW